MLSLLFFLLFFFLLFLFFLFLLLGLLLFLLLLLLNLLLFLDLLFLGLLFFFLSLLLFLLFLLFYFLLLRLLFLAKNLTKDAATLPRLRAALGIIFLGSFRYSRDGSSTLRCAVVNFIIGLGRRRFGSSSCSCTCDNRFAFDSSVSQSISSINVPHTIFAQIAFVTLAVDEAFSGTLGLLDGLLDGNYPTISFRFVGSLESVLLSMNLEGKVLEGLFCNVRCITLGYVSPKIVLVFCYSIDVPNSKCLEEQTYLRHAWRKGEVPCQFETRERHYGSYARPSQF